MKTILMKDESLSKVTQKVIENFNTMSDKEFFRKYSVSKHKYLKRFIKTDGGSVVLSDGTELPVARARKEYLSKSMGY